MRRVTCSIVLLMLVLASGCTAGEAPRGSTPTTSSVTSPPVAPDPVGEGPADGPSVEDLPPPLPDTPCLPETPVEVDLIGQYGYACLVTPYRWKVTNTSLTVLQLEPGAADYPVSLVDATVPTGGPPTADVAALVARYRQSRTDTYWLQPQDTVEVTWGSGPGFLSYHADPAESAARTLVSQGLDSLTNLGRPASASDVLACVEGVSDAVRDTSQLTEDTWNKVVTNGLTLSGCVDVVDEASDSGLKARLRLLAERVWTQVKTLVKSPSTVVRYFR